MSTVLDILLGLTIAFLVVRSTLPGVVKQVGRHACPCCRWPCPGLVMAFGYLAISSRLQV